MVAFGILTATFLPLAAATLAQPRALQVHEALADAPRGFTRTRTAAPDTTLPLRIALTPRNASGLEARLYDVSTPSSANYGKFLSKDEVAEYVAPTEDTVRAVGAWLSAHGLAATPSSPAGDWLALDVSVGQANALLGADYAVYTHGASGRELVRTLSYALPEDLKPHVVTVHPTIAFTPSLRAHAPIFETFGDANAGRAVAARDDVQEACKGPVTPKCLQALYGIPAAPATQSSNRFAITGYIEQYANEQDLQQFLTDYRPDIANTTTFTLQTLDGGQNSQNISEAGVEAALDTQYALGLATGVPVDFVSVGSENTDGDLSGFLDTVHFFLGQDAPPHVVSTSYGALEDEIPANLSRTLCHAYAQLGARGVSMIYSTGDGGVTGGDFYEQPVSNCTKFVPTWPAGCPYITMVGATQGTAPETAANFSSGGFSNVFPTPPYQRSAAAAYLSALGPDASAAGRFNAHGRGYPDVSAQGVNFTIVYQGRARHVSGTSASAPVFAAVVALLNDRLVRAGRSPLGFLNPFLYGHGRAAFNDVTEGNNPGCGTDGFPAKEGWDPITGLGTPDFNKLLKAVGL
ncbi:family S53 protease [Trametes elegans]|nr:family S53 protease [Trametes elegans]